MSNAEEQTTADILLQYDIENIALEKDLLKYWIDKCRKDANAHTKQRLTALKERVQSRVWEIEVLLDQADETERDVYLYCLSELKPILTLIEDQIQ